jgi:murein DD-endopeptidase MepM/ murein hydrolase activator NlpD
VSVARRAAALAVALVLAGCGSNNAPTPTAPTPLATPAPVTSASSSASAAAPSVAPAAAQPLVQYYLPAAAGTKLAVTNTNLDTGLDAGDHAPGEQGQYAFDFGTGNNAPFTVVAARAGTVIGLQRDSTTQCKGLNTDIDGTADPGCWTKANYVLVDQGDGTAALYMHLAPNSVPATPPVGSPVCLGTPLGTDGQTGWATGPHVHFQVEAKPTVPVPTAANPGVTDPNAIRPGWWWADSQRIAQGFSDPDVLAKAPSGIPPRGSYTSGNPGTGCPGDAAPPAAPTITPTHSPALAPPPAPTAFRVAARGAGNTISCDSSGCFYNPSGGPSPWRLTWNDTGSETGYRVYVSYDGWVWDAATCAKAVRLPRHLIATLSKNTTHLDGIWTAEGDGSTAHPILYASTYYIVAYNAAGQSKYATSSRIMYIGSGPGCTTP